MRLVKRVHFRSHDKDGGYTIQSALPENPMLHANITALCLIEWELLPIEVVHCGIGIFDLLGSCDLDLDLDLDKDQIYPQHLYTTSSISLTDLI